MDVIVQISETEFTGWELLIDPFHTYKMLYSLQLINALTDVGQHKAKVGTPIEFDSAWRLKFIEKGGLTHLFQLLLTTEVDKPESACLQPVMMKRKSRRKAAI